MGEGAVWEVCTGMVSNIARVLVLCVDTRLCMSLQSHFDDSSIPLMSSVIPYCIMCVPHYVLRYLWESHIMEVYP